MNIKQLIDELDAIGERIGHDKAVLVNGKNVSIVAEYHGAKYTPYGSPVTDDEGVQRMIKYAMIRDTENC